MTLRHNFAALYYYIYSSIKIFKTVDKYFKFAIIYNNMGRSLPKKGRVHMNDNKVTNISDVSDEDKLDNIIRLLREQLVLCKRLSDIFEGLKKNLRDGNSTGTGVTDSVQAIEPIALELSRHEAKMNEFLKNHSTKEGTEVRDLGTVIGSLPSGIKRGMAETLLAKIEELHKKLKHQTVSAATLLVNGKAFIDYNINVLSQTKADNTYGPPGKQFKAQSGRRVFEANV